MGANRELLLGLDIGGTKIAAAVAAAGGEIVRRDTLRTDPEQGGQRVLDRALQAGSELVRSAGDAPSILAGVGLATMGVTREDEVLFAPNVPGWSELRIPERLRAVWPNVPQRVDNDVKAAARAEAAWGALSDIDVGLYVNLGTGIAVAPVVGGQVLEGAHGAAGEIGYNPRHPHLDAGVAAGHSPLEEYVGGAAVARRAFEVLGRKMSAEALFAASDPPARVLTATIIEEIAHHLTNTVIALDPTRVVIGGGYTGAADIILPVLENHMRRFVPFPPEVTVSNFPHDGSLMGALVLAETASRQAREDMR